MSEVIVRVAGIGIYAPGLTGWAVAAAALRGGAVPELSDPPRPAPPLLPAAERRRAPDTVLYAAQAAAEACAMAQADPATLPCVFSSTQGDIAITDYMCSTLATAPRELSPTKFHNSVHNAAAGYWSIATGCRAPSTAVSAWINSFGSGLFEAAVQAADDAAPMLLVVYDAAAAGPLRSTIPFDCGFALALVLAPDEPSAAGARLRLSAASTAGVASEPTLDWARTLCARNACADSLALLQALAVGEPATLRIDAGPSFALLAQVMP